MNAVVYDLELMKRFKKGQLSEIVEIGACKIDIHAKKIIYQFQIYILPRSGHISKSTRKFIKMKPEDVAGAVDFKKGISLFSSWLGEDYYLCSWGRDDKVHFIDQCIRSKVKLDWLVNHNDIQKPIGKILSEENNQLGLKTALQLANIEPLGIAHRGIDDAINTAQLLLKYIDQIELNSNRLTSKEKRKYYAQYSRPLNKQTNLKPQ